MNFGQDTLQVVEIKLDNRKILWSIASASSIAFDGDSAMVRWVR
jgi:hypothetical protein